MTLFYLNMVLALIWVILVGQYQPGSLISHFVLGFLLGYFLLWMGKPFLKTKNYFVAESDTPLTATLAKLPKRIWGWIKFTAIFFVELLKANLQLVIGVLSPLSRLKPGILAIPLDVTTDAEITLLANMITLTPGTLSLDLSNDRQVLYVYFFNVTDPEQDKQAIKDGFEKMVQEVLR